MAGRNPGKGCEVVVLRARQVWSLLMKLAVLKQQRARGYSDSGVPEVLELEPRTCSFNRRLRPGQCRWLTKGPWAELAPPPHSAAGTRTRCPGPLSGAHVGPREGEQMTGRIQTVEQVRALKGARRPLVLNKPHIRGAHAVGDGKGRKDWAAWAPISCRQNNGFFRSLASELAAGHQGRKEPA